MKIDRLIGILSILLQQDKVTAPMLAEKFEVSRRTINRDIEDICKAGIPLVTMQGQNGGISIMDGFCIDRTLLTSADMQDILTGLKSLDSVSGTKRYQQLMEKLSADNASILSSNQHITIDLTAWGGTNLAPKIELIQNAIDKNLKITFDYYGPSGDSSRKVEPAQLIFQWSNWYLWAYCCEKQDYRLFKLNRMLKVTLTEESAEIRESSMPVKEQRYEYPKKLKAKVILEPEVRWRLIDEFGVDSFTQMEDGRLEFCSEFSDEHSLMSWIMTFGDQAELIEPVALRSHLLEIVRHLEDKYKTN